MTRDERYVPLRLLDLAVMTYEHADRKLGRAIRAARAAGVSRAEVCRRTGLTAADVRRIEQTREVTSAAG